MSVYLDYNASTPIDPRVLETMIDVYQNHYGNADSRTHDYGEGARQLLDQARANVAMLLQVNKGEVFFTSGATESDNIATLGLRTYGEKNNRKHIISTTIEHKAILEPLKHLEKCGFEIELVNPDQSGRINVDELLGKVREDTLLVSVMYANNETGIIQPVREIGEALADTKTIFHVDAAQSCGKLVEELQSLKYDMLSISAHKMYGPQGIGALILRKKRYRLPPVNAIMFGGQQENGLRPGTTPVALTVGFGQACILAAEEYHQNVQHEQKIKKDLIAKLNASGLSYVVNGASEYCMPHTLNVSLKGISSEALMLATKQYCGISNGSACTSHDYSPSYVLKAMEMPLDQIESALRISWGYNTKIEQVNLDFQALLTAAQKMI